MHVAVVNLNCTSVDSGLVCYTAVFSGVTQRSAPEFPGMWFGSQRDDTKNGSVQQTKSVRTRSAFIKE